MVKVKARKYEKPEMIDGAFRSVSVPCKLLITRLRRHYLHHYYQGYVLMPNQYAPYNPDFGDGVWVHVCERLNTKLKLPTLEPGQSINV